MSELVQFNSLFGSFRARHVNEFWKISPKAV